ncbi:hypothetical protein E2C01_078490 [Portunus trituberculatus]|uniref:Uncharacterized protein n=1 Tax=Portunus trituberculatus TaxID=210409 RepID=A0A5B7IU95_PORTR|nr:hypothetical protein [Portunus trituberculatus]
MSLVFSANHSLLACSLSTLPLLLPVLCHP